MKPPGADAPGGMVWDLGVRACHRLLVLLIGFAWWTYKSDLMIWRRRTGCAITIPQTAGACLPCWRPS